MAHDVPEQVVMVLSISMGEKQLQVQSTYVTAPMGLERESERLASHIKQMGDSLAQLWLSTARGTKPIKP